MTLETICARSFASIKKIKQGADPSEINFLETCRLIRQLFAEDHVFRLRFNHAFRLGLTNTTQDKELEPLVYLIHLLSEKFYDRHWIFPQYLFSHLL